MGCCSFKQEDILGGLVLPDLENSIHQAQQQHPFSLFEPQIVIHLLSDEQNKSEITQTQFEKVLKKLNIPSKQFFSPRHPLNSYTRAITTITKGLNIQKLKLTAILLGKADFETKLNLLVDAYNSGFLIQAQTVRKMIQGVVDISIRILPRLGKMKATPGEYNNYMTRLQSLEKYLIQDMTSRIMKGKTDKTLLELLEYFKMNPTMLKLLWPQGIRVIAMQEDISILEEQKRGKNLQTLSRASSLGYTREEFSRLSSNRTPRKVSTYRSSRNKNHPLIKFSSLNKNQLPEEKYQRFNSANDKVIYEESVDELASVPKPSKLKIELQNEYQDIPWPISSGFLVKRQLNFESSNYD